MKEERLQEADRYNYIKLLQESQLADLSDVLDLISMPDEVIASAGFDFDDFIVECTFDRTNCAHRRYWTEFYSHKRGRCWTLTLGQGACYLLAPATRYKTRSERVNLAPTTA